MIENIVFEQAVFDYGIRLLVEDVSGRFLVVAFVSAISGYFLKSLWNGLRSLLI